MIRDGRDWQEGRMSPRDWQLHICRRLGVNLTFEQFSEIWNRVLDPKPQVDISFLENLSKRYTLAVLSNTDPIHVAELEKKFDFFRFFPQAHLFLRGGREQTFAGDFSRSADSLQSNRRQRGIHR